MRKRLLLILGGLLLLILAGCGGAGSGAVGAVTTYYQAVLSQNADQLKSVTCADFQEQALTELDSFQGVKTELQGFSCKETGQAGGAAQVKCDGKIVAAYGSETMDFPLSDRVHQVQQIDGRWQVCGY